MYAESFLKLRERVERACERVGRSREGVLILPVTKTIDMERFREAYDAGLRFAGESRVQELTEKKEILPRDIHWHFIGHLQTNKAKKVVGEVELIHSLDSVRLGETLSELGEKKTLPVPVLIEVNTSGEATKSGFDPMALENALDQLQKLPRLQFRGLMTIGPLTSSEAEVRRSFALLRTLREKLAARFEKDIFRELSMGMTSDFEIAIEEGSTIIRIGTLLFGERK